MQSPIYWHPKLYSAAMRLLYGKHYLTRYQDLAKLIPANSRVLDVCMGDARLYTDYLKSKNVDYTCLDINDAFIKHAQAQGINAQQFDLRDGPVPTSDIVVVQGSLYQFIPDEREIMRKLLAATRNTLIIAEPVKNLSTSCNRVISWVARKASATRELKADQRFNARKLLTLFTGFREFKEAVPAAGRRELIGIFKTAA